MRDPIAPDGPDAAAQAQRLPLPSHRYLPGVNARHRPDAFDPIKSRLPAETREENAATSLAWHYGLRLLQQGYCWEAHEVLEEVWRRARPNSRERWLVQCLIHIANRDLKARIGQNRAATRLAALAEECLARAFAGQVSTVMGISRESLEPACTAATAKITAADKPLR